MEGDKRKILIVDDDTFLLDMYAFKFSQHNFEVYTASGGLQVIEKLKDKLNPDIILMDIIMPDMDGFEMLEKINKDNLSPSSTKIILTNKSQQSDIDRGNNLGASGYIVKASSTPAEVISQVVEILSKKVAVKK
ncbi:MAG: Response regulator receiver domain protein [Candidatus Nomurabacteria bacterium GW2011_GWF2_35_12]|uniref:Response regulator receiver domain protein n=3 Tax=Candidatus Nomuraibacteriota TaxID=1752729 RepID=A0A0G0H446_9BACT|nr:MAG: Response regulator receiver domain protein [Candidatus Nomurabacteria bacterium GW2011_GWF2_35_12]KKP72561.1 MAG: Response regulator receiver domain protein [Candidatus Nomurabacteria bacterium GW2011_GWB1_35_20]KKP76590.1 MAG: Response regulator receiver domain protein [Parcubacteria group bacterium GW2011_GWC1_35_21]KKP78457.1 MAG: Response regulator receiver domain protein [Candidatus Nomurabacteria bacterium GW2011_GWC2_35_35]KKP84735.1 MAG: Response regulator receiver domain protei